MLASRLPDCLSLRTDWMKGRDIYCSGSGTLFWLYSENSFSVADATISIASKEKVLFLCGILKCGSNEKEVGVVLTTRKWVWCLER